MAITVNPGVLISRRMEWRRSAIKLPIRLDTWRLERKFRQG
jgi:hypothetical protein